HLGPHTADNVICDHRAARHRRACHEPVEAPALNLPGQLGAENAPADLPRAQAHHRRRHADADRGPRARAHDAPALTVPAAAARFGMTRYRPRSKRRTRCRYRKVWSGQLLVLRPEAVVYQLWHPLSHTELRLAVPTHVLNACCTSGRTSSQ